MGCLQGDVVQCGYHGFQFDAAGFPVIEQAPYIWIWLGDPQRIESTPAPHKLEWASDPSFSAVQGRIEVAANYLLLKENVLDLTHFG